MAKPQSNYRQGKLKEEAKASKPPQSDDWTLEGWLNVSKSGKMLKVSIQEGEASRVIGLVSIRQAERLLAGEISGVPFKLPPAKEETE
jgi:hypothetical protein